MPAHPNPDKDEPVNIPLDPEEALRALMQVEMDEVEQSSSSTKPPNRAK